MTAGSPLRSEEGRLVAVAVVIVGLFVALTYGALTLGTDAVTEQARARVQGNAAVGVTFIEDTLGSIETLAQGYAADADMVAAVGNGGLDDVDGDRVSSIFGPVTRWIPGIAAMAVTTLGGRLVTSVPEARGLQGVDFSYRDWYRGVAASGELYVSQVYVSSLDGRRVVGVATPIRRAGGAAVGYLVITYEVAAIKAFINGFAANGVLFTVTDQSGVVVAAPADTPSELVSLHDDPAVVEALAGQAGLRDRSVAGEDWVSAYTPVPGLGWTVRADVPAAAAYSGVSTLRRTVLVMAGVLAVALCGAFLFVGRSVGRRRRAESEARLAVSLAESDRERLASIVAAQHEIATAGIDTDLILSTVGRWALVLTKADGVAVLLPDGDDLVVRAAFADASPAVGVRVTETDLGSDSVGPMDSIQARSSMSIPLPGHGPAQAGRLMVSSRSPGAFGDRDFAALELIAGMAGMALAEAASFATLEEGERRHRAVTDHLPDTAVMVWDADLRLQTAAGPGTRMWRYAERGVLPGRLLEEIVSPDELMILEPFYRSGLNAPGVMEYHSEPTGLDFQFETVPMFAADGTPDRVLVMVRDITQRKLDTEALRLAEKRFRTAFEAAPVGIAELGLDGSFRQVNVAMCELIGCDAAALRATTWMAITHPDDVADAVAMQSVMTAGGTAEHAAEMRLVRTDGAIVWVSVSTAVVFDGEGNPDHVLSHYLDITERKRFHIELQYLADHDPLTGTRNRRSFEAALETHIANVASDGLCGALLVLDLDNFKQVNDMQGHSAGDALIVAFANVLGRRVRATDVIGRLGGDEFAVILPRATPAQAEQVAGNILHAVRHEMRSPGGTQPNNVTTSIGIAMFDRPDLSAKDVMIEADLSMYDAKSRGRDQYARSRSARAAHRFLDSVDFT